MCFVSLSPSCLSPPPPQQTSCSLLKLVSVSSESPRLRRTPGLCLSTRRRRRRRLRCLIHRCLSYFVETLFFTLPSSSSSSSSFPLVAMSTGSPSGLSGCMNPAMKSMPSPGYRSCAENNQSAVARRSRRCLIIQTAVRLCVDYKRNPGRVMNNLCWWQSSGCMEVQRTSLITFNTLISRIFRNSVSTSGSSSLKDILTLLSPPRAPVSLAGILQR